ncbi:MAG: hypothetical protein AAB606_01355 [Patescibacteria group bacterium]
MILVGAIVLVVAAVIGVTMTSSRFSKGSLNVIPPALNVQNACPEAPRIAYRANVNAAGNQRGLYGVQLTSGSFQQIKNYLENGCNLKTVIKGTPAFAGSRNSDIFECQTAESSSTSFYCHFGQSYRFARNMREANPHDTVLADTYINIAQTGDNEFTMRTEGRVLDGSHVEPFAPTAIGVNPDFNGIVTVFASR